MGRGVRGGRGGLSQRGLENEGRAQAAGRGLQRSGGQNRGRDDPPARDRSRHHNDHPMSRNQNGLRREEDRRREHERRREGSGGRDGSGRRRENDYGRESRRDDYRDNERSSYDERSREDDRAPPRDHVTSSSHYPSVLALNAPTPSLQPYTAAPPPFLSVGAAPQVLPYPGYPGLLGAAYVPAQPLPGATYISTRPVVPGAVYDPSSTYPGPTFTQPGAPVYASALTLSGIPMFAPGAAMPTLPILPTHPLVSGYNTVPSLYNPVPSGNNSVSSGAVPSVPSSSQYTAPNTSGVMTVKF